MIDRTSFAPFVFVEHDDPPVRDCGGRSRPRYGLLLHGVDMERAVATLARAGVSCDGTGWHDVAEGLARRELPDEVDLLTFDSDGQAAGSGVPRPPCARRPDSARVTVIDYCS
ncbi:hypothetical protein [Micromonospora sp. NPDC049497]|uniref:hypothetical protein n=1 Tax=Micromonospora sp. NPDC049497 TaxID=3364273 RepID=UPI003790623C